MCRKRLLVLELRIQAPVSREVARAPRETVPEEEVAVMELCQWSQPSSQPIAMVRDRHFVSDSMINF